MASSYYNETYFLLLRSHQGHVCMMCSMCQAGKWDLLCVCQSVFLTHAVWIPILHEWTLSDMVLEAVLPLTFMPVDCLKWSKKKKKVGKASKQITNYVTGGRSWTMTQRLLSPSSLCVFAMTVIQHSWWRFSAAIIWLCLLYLIPNLFQKQFWKTKPGVKILLFASHFYHRPSLILST